MKRCSRCKTEKDLSCFAVNDNYCKTCRRAWHQNRRFIPRTCSKCSESATPTSSLCKAHSAEHVRDWKRKNRPLFFRIVRGPRPIEKWVQAAYSHRRRERTRNSPGKPPSIPEIRSLREWFDERCAYCGEKSDKLELDHVDAIANGGAHSIENLVPACLPCNRSKGTKGVLAMLNRPWRGRASPDSNTRLQQHGNQ